MTSYTQKDYYFNEIDALSCNNRPISSTLRSKSTYNAYENQTEDDATCYDIYGNQEYNDGSSCDSYNPQPRSTSTMSNAGNYNVSHYGNKYCNNVITTDNLMYHRDACSGDSSQRYDIYSTLDYDNLRDQCINYRTTRADMDENLRPYTSLGDSSNNKIPPVQHSHSMWDGMYGSGQQRQSNISLPSTPTFSFNDGGSVGGRIMGYSNDDWDRGCISNDISAQLNGHRQYDFGSGGGSRFYGRKPPERILPLPQSQLQPQPQTYLKKTLKQQFFQNNSDNMATKTTSISSYRNEFNLDYKNAMPVSSKTQNLPSHNIYYDNDTLIEPPVNSSETDYNNSYNSYEYGYSIEPCPHTAMQSRDEYNDFGISSADNMSTYSDTTIPTSLTNASQQKLQDLQKCRYSIIMAMTTASVIASGETRIPQYLLKKTTKPSAVMAPSSQSNESTGEGMTSSVSYKYDDSNYFENTDSNIKDISVSGSNTLGSCAYTNITLTPTQSTAALPSVTLSTAATSSMMLLLSASPIVADSSSNTTTSIGSSTTNLYTTTAMRSSGTDTGATMSLVKNLTSRKLPKHHTGRVLVTSIYLPQSPQYQLSYVATSKSLPVTVDTLDNINETSSILSTASATLLPTISTTSSSISSTYSLLSFQGTSLASMSFATPKAEEPTTIMSTAIKTSLSIAKTITTTTNHLLSNNNNNINYENLNNYKNNNFFHNNVQSDNKYSIGVEEEKQDEEKRTEEESIYHLSTTPSRLNSLITTNDTTSIASHNSYKTRVAYDSLITFPSLPVDKSNVTTETFLTTTSTISKEKNSTAISSNMFDNDYKTNYADYLKPYTLPTFSSSSIISNNTNLFTQSTSNSYLPYTSLDVCTSYLTFSSSMTTNTITAISTASPFTSLTITSTSISTLASNLTLTSTSANATQTETASKLLAINNTELNNIRAALNLSDNISSKSSISSPVSKISSPSGSVVSITSVSCYPTVALTPSTAATTKSIRTTTTPLSNIQTSSNTLAAYLDFTNHYHQNDRKENNNNQDLKANATKQSEFSVSSSSLYINDYDNYLKDYKLDFATIPLTSSSITEPATTTSSSPTTRTSATTTTSSSILNKSLPTSTMMMSSCTTTITTTINDNNCYTINNNEVVNGTTSTLLSLKPDCLFTTTKTTSFDADYTLTSTPTQDSLITTAATTSDLYRDYLNDYSTVMTSLSTSVVSDITDKPSQELPAYIMDFLVTSKSNDYSDSLNYLNLYKTKSHDDDDVLQATTNNNLINTSLSFPNDIPKIADDLLTAVTTVGDATCTKIIVSPINEIAITVTTVQAPISTTTTSSPTKLIVPTENQVTDDTASTTVDFDDNFYSSFSVNLNTLIADTTTTAVSTNSTTTVITATRAVSNYDIKEFGTIPEVEASSDIAKPPFGTTNTVTATATTLPFVDTSTVPSDSIDITISSTANSIVQSQSQSAITSSSKSTPSTQKQTTAGGKASSMLGGLSQSLKGGLDGVLGAAGSNEPQQKRGFGFGLASKFVPSVGGLLASAAKPSTKNSAIPSKQQQSKAITTVAIPAQAPQISTSYGNQIDYNHDTSTTESLPNQNSVPPTINEGYYNDITTSDNVIITTSPNKDADFVVLTQITDPAYNSKENGAGGLYYNSSQPTYYHMTSSLDYAQDEMVNHSEQMTMYDDVITGDKEYYANGENHTTDMYEGFSENQSVTTTGNLIDNSIAYTKSGEIVQTTHESIKAISSSTAMESNNSNVTAAKKATSSLFSSLTNVASQISQQTAATTADSTTITAPTRANTTNATSAKATGSGSSGGGMFGSIFGKAAAAMQTATQVVNQGASLASTKVQKNLQPTSAVSVIKRVSTIEEPTTCATTTVTVTSAAENNYQKPVISHQDSLASPYTSSIGNDYDNSNIRNTDEDFSHIKDDEEYYYTNQNQPNQLVHQQSQQKLLPTVPPGSGSTGKKLPTINDKLGCLVKQQPTEICEEHNKSKPFLKRVPTYDIDSEQVDYYMDTQPVVPSTTNGYYEHTNGGSYDYRDDYFNEEDELKYLEKEKLHDKDNVIYNQLQQQQQQEQEQLRQIYKQSSLQYVLDDDYQHDKNDEIVDEYIEDMYHSEDSGNYLDESSSGSIKAVLATHQHTVPSTTAATALDDGLLQTKTSSSSVISTTTTTPSVPTVSHQQIKKQDSIILEDDKNEISSISKSLSRKSSNDVLDIEDDQMGDLQMVSAGLRSSQSRKVKLIRGETEEVVGGQIQIMKRKTEVTAKQRWHWAYNKIIIQLNGREI